MNDIRNILERLGKIGESSPISESMYDWGNISDPAEIRANVMAHVVDWFNGGSNEGIFAEVLVTYLTALKINPNESKAMKTVMLSAVDALVADYKIWVKEDSWLDFGDEMLPAIAKLREMGLQSKKLDAIEQDFAKRKKKLDARYS